MALLGAVERWRHGAERWLDARIETVVKPRYPDVALELTATHATSVSMTEFAGGSPRGIRQWRSIELPAGLVQPSLLRLAITDAAALRPFLLQALDGLPGLDRRMSLVLPDVLAKLSLVSLDASELGARDGAEILRWKLKRTTPFRVEDARVAYQVFPRKAGGSTCLVALSLGVVLGQIEDLLESMGYEVGVVDFASFSLWNLLESSFPERGDVLLVNLGHGYATFLVARDREPLFLRCKTSAEGAISAAEAVAEIRPTLLYYQDRVGGSGIVESWVRAAPALAAPLCEALESQHGIASRVIDTLGIPGAPAVENEWSRLLPAVGAAMGR